MKKTFNILSLVCGIGCIVYGFLYFNGLQEVDHVTVAMYAWALGFVGIVGAFRK